MALTTEEQQEDGVRAGREIIAAAQGWNGWLVAGDATTAEEMMSVGLAVTQLTLAALDRDRGNVGTALYGIGVAIGAMVAVAPDSRTARALKEALDRPDSRTARALKEALDRGVARGRRDMAAELTPKGRA